MAVWLTSVLIRIDTALWEAEWRTSAREGLFLFLSISFFWSSVLPRGEAKLVLSPPHKGWCDCRAFHWAKRQELYLKIHFSTSSLFLPLFSLGRYGESLLAPVCVEGKRRLFLFPSQRCRLLRSHNLRYCLTSRRNSETCKQLAWRFFYQRQDCQGMTSTLAKAYMID